MTDEQLQQLAALAQAATPGPWHTVQMAYCHSVWAPHPVTGESVCIAVIEGGLSNDSKHDAAFIAAARDGVPALIAEVERLRNAIRNADTLDELTHLVGATAEENEEARKRIEAIDALYAAHGIDMQRWPATAIERNEALQSEQYDYESRYC